MGFLAFWLAGSRDLDGRRKGRPGQGRTEGSERARQDGNGRRSRGQDGGREGDAVEQEGDAAKRGSSRTFCFFSSSFSPSFVSFAAKKPSPFWGFSHVTGF